MSFLGFLKKDKKEDSDDIPMPPKVKDNQPNILPPADMPSKQVHDDFGTGNIPPNMDLNKPKETQKEPSDNSFNLDNFEDAKKDSKISKPETTQPENNPAVSDEKVPVQEEDFDFSLPDFSEEDFKLGEINKEETEDKKPGEKKEENTNTEDVTMTMNLASAETKKQTSGNKEYYLTIMNCKKTFEQIGLANEIFETSKELFQKSDANQKNLVQQYKNNHDYLDQIQEKLMEIDQTLFER